MQPSNLEDDCRVPNMFLGAIAVPNHPFGVNTVGGADRERIFRCAYAGY